MMKSKLLILTSAMLLALTTYASAEISAVVSPTKDEINVTGKSTDYDVSLTLFNDGVTEQDIYDLINNEDADGINAGILYFETVQPVNGAYSLTIPLNEGVKKGEFMLFAGEESTKVYFSSVEDKLGMVAEAKSALSSGKFDSFIKENANYIADATKLASISDISRMARIAEGMLDKNKLVEGSSDSLELLANAINQAIVVEQLNEGLISDVKDIANLISADNQIVPISYLDAITNKEVVLKAINSKGYTTAKDFYLAFNQALFIEVFNNLDSMSAEERKAFFEAYGEDCGLSFKKYNKLTTKQKQSVVNQLSTYKLDTISDMQSKLDSLADKELSKSSSTTSGGGGSSGGGSSSGGGAGGLYTTGTVKPNTPTADDYANYLVAPFTLSNKTTVIELIKSLIK